MPTLNLSAAGTLTRTGGKPGPRQIVLLSGRGSLACTAGTVYGTNGRSLPIPAGVSGWTFRWWQSLPAAYRLADAVQNPEIGGYPLLRWMEGIGRIANDIREVSDALWFGRVMNPATTGAGNLKWMAQMLGVSSDQRAMPTGDLRDYLQDLVSAGLPAVGTRQSIADAAKRFLIGTKQTVVMPDDNNQFNLILLVKSSDVPNGDLEAYAQGVRATGVIPAGFTITAVAAVASWDAWTAAAGTTWLDREGVTGTWTEADSLGVNLI